MGKDWKDNLANFFEDLVIIRHSQQEARDQFNQFCEFIAEPAFEELEKEFRHYKIRSKIKQKKGESIELKINFPKSRMDNFRYTLLLPKNQLELGLKLLIQGRITKASPEETLELNFMEGMTPAELLKMSKEVLMEDVIGRYSVFNMKATVRRD